MTQKSNSDNIERYLRHCVNDLNIQACSLFKEFLQPQRDEDNVIPKEVVHSYVQQQQSIIEEHHTTNINNTREIISNPNTTINTTTEEDSIVNSSFISYTSFPSNISNNIQPQHQQPQGSFVDQDMNSSLISSNSPVTIQDFQLIKVIGRGCMGKVSFKPCV